MNLYRPKSGPIISVDTVSKYFAIWSLITMNEEEEATTGEIVEIVHTMVMCDRKR